MKKNNNIQVLISTMDRTNIDFLKDMNLIDKNCLVINQSIDNKTIESQSDSNIRIINSQEKGLSKSRNLALYNSDAEICVIADDDVKYNDDFENSILKAYKEHPNYDIISFYVENKDKERAKKRIKEGNIGFLKSRKLQSVQLTFKRESIINKNIHFDENFGAGTDTFFGEENIFLFDCLKNKIKIYNIPIKIGELKPSDSSWFEGYNKKYLFVQGRVYRKLFGKIIGDIFSIIFVFRHYNLFSTQYTFFETLKSILKK